MLPIKLDDQLRDKLAREQARSAVSSIYDEYKIKSLEPKIQTPISKKVKNKQGVEHIQTITKVDFEVNYYKENVHKSVNNDKKNVIKVVKNIEKENFNTISTC